MTVTINTRLPPRQFSTAVISVRNEIFRPTSETVPVARGTPDLDC